MGHSLRALHEPMPLTVGEILSLEAWHRLVLVDGLWLKRAGPTGAHKAEGLGRQRPVTPKQKRVMWTALGLWEEGHGEILTWDLAPNEAAASWRALVDTLYTKGIMAQTTQWVVSDESPGLAMALDSHLYGVPHQRRLFHTMKNITAYVPYRALRTEAEGGSTVRSRHAQQQRKQAICADAGQMYATDVEGERRARAQAFRETWADREPHAVAVRNGFAQT